MKFVKVVEKPVLQKMTRLHERTLSDFAAAKSATAPNAKTMMNDFQIKGFERPQPRIIIERNDSAAHVVGNNMLISFNTNGKASTGHRIPDNRSTGNTIGMTSCIA